MITLHACARALFILFPVALTACGGEETSRIPVDQAGLETEIGTVTSPLVTGGVNVSQGIAPDSELESETAAIAMGGGQHLVAYDSRDHAHRVGTDFCSGYSQLAASYLTNGTTWRGIRVPTPSGVSALWGDPSATFADGGSLWFVYLSTMATSTAAWNLALKDPAHPTCVDSATAEGLATDRICSATLLVPKNGDPVTPFSTTCFGSGDGLDGGQMYYSTTGGHTYLAAWNTSKNRIDVYKDNVLITTPFGATSIFGHPKFVPHASVPTILAPTSAGNFMVARFNESSSIWTTYPLTTGGDFTWNQDVVLKSGVSVRTVGYSADMYQVYGTDQLVFFYTRKSVAGVRQVVGANCAFLGFTGSCQQASNWISAAGANALVPAVAVAIVGTSDFRGVVSYWSDSGSSSGTLTLNYGRINASTGGFTITATNSTEKPCPLQTVNYWGDYDTMTVDGQGTALPVLVRYFTDSTASTCAAGLPQHVSYRLDLP